MSQRRIGCLGLLLFCLLCLPARGQTPSLQERADAARQAARQYHENLLDLYMQGNWAELEAQLKLQARHSPDLTPDMRKDVRYIQDAMAECRPAWWAQCSSASNVSFEAMIWKRRFTANFMPSEMLGAQGPVSIRNGKLDVVVTWRPNLVNDPKPADGELSKRHGILRRDIGEMIVWHELGHNYISVNLPLEHVLELYIQHEILFAHLQEFYADLTAIYHAGPRARRVAMLLRLRELDANNELDPHGRAAHAIGSLLLTHVLQDPSRWPSIHLPGQVPSGDVERQTIIYMYENLAAGWTFQEDAALRAFVWEFIRRAGEGVLRSRGTVPLPDRLQFKLTAGEDRQFQQARDRWVADKLAKLIAAGRTDPPTTQPATTRNTQTTIRRPDGSTVTIRRAASGPRIDVPW